MSESEMPVPLEYTDCYVAFLDILGMKQFVAESVERPELQVRLLNVLKWMDQLSPYVAAQRIEQSARFSESVLRIHVLSDSVILFIPSATTSVAGFLWTIRRVYDRLVCEGFCLRGGATLGGMVWESQTIEARNPGGYQSVSRSSISMGPALVEAYVLESKKAKHPRVLIGERLREHIEELDRESSSTEGAAMKRRPFPLADPNYPGRIGDFIKTDEDGFHFLDILHPAVRRGDQIGGSGTKEDPNRFDPTTRDEWIERYRSLASRGLDSAREECVRSKYEWLLNYVNNAGSTVPQS